MNLYDRMTDRGRVSEGSMSTERQRTKAWMMLHRAGITLSPWVRLALQNQLRSAGYGGLAR